MDVYNSSSPLDEESLRTYISTLCDIGVFRPGREHNGWINFPCPVHSQGQEKHASFGISLISEYRDGKFLESGFCSCFACHFQGSFVNLLQEILQTRDNLSEIQIDAVKRILHEIQTIKPQASPLASASESLMRSFERIQLNAAQNNKLRFEKHRYISEEELAKYRYTVDYMKQRKLTDEVISKYDIGFDANYTDAFGKADPCITFPVRDWNHKTKYIIRRTINHKKYIIPDNVQKGCFGLDMVDPYSKVLVVTESVINALNLAGYHFPENASFVSMLGTGSSEAYREIEQTNIYEICCWLDGDNAGRRGTQKFLRYFSRKNRLVSFVTQPEGTDINDLNLDQLKELYETRTYDFELMRKGEL